MCGSEKKQCICLLYSRFQDCTRTLVLRVFLRIEAYNWINASSSSTGELSMSLGISRWTIHYSLAFHIIFSVLSISMPLLLCIAEEPGLWNKDPCSLLAQRRRVNLYLWSRVQHGDLVCTRSALAT